MPSVNRAASRSFTLLEVLLVLAILAVLAAIVVPNLVGRQRKAKIQATRITIAGVDAALKIYAAEHDGEYPSGSAEQVFQTLMYPPQTGATRVSPYLEQLPTDAWDQPLYYEFPSDRHRHGSQPAIWSSGPDQTNDNGAGDDLNNWDGAGR